MGMTMYKQDHGRQMTLCMDLDNRRRRRVANVYSKYTESNPYRRRIQAQLLTPESMAWVGKCCAGSEYGGNTKILHEHRSQSD